MSKYEAHSNAGGNWAVREAGRLGSVGGPYAYYTESEAQIIAFALNAIAEGSRIGRKDEWSEWATYTGPTEGIAPK